MYNSLSKLYITASLANPTANKNGIYYPPTVESVTIFEIINGVFVVDTFVVSSVIRDVKLSFWSDAINIFIPDNLNFYHIDKKEQNFNFSIHLRECLPGEEYQASGKCAKCAKGDYYLLEAADKQTNCKECLRTKSQCEGGNQIYPLRNYWRSSIYSDNFMRCRNDIACM